LRREIETGAWVCAATGGTMIVVTTASTISAFTCL
jgi:hypothetical protein